MKKTLLTSVILFFGTLSLLGQEESTQLVSENWGDYYFVNQNHEKAVNFYARFKDSIRIDTRRNWALALSELNKKSEAKMQYAIVANSVEARVEDYYVYAGLLYDEKQLAMEYRDKSFRLPWSKPSLFENDSLLFKKRFDQEAYSINSLKGNTKSSEFGMLFLTEEEKSTVFYLSEQDKSKASEKVLKRIKTDYPFIIFTKVSSIKLVSHCLIRKILVIRLIPFFKRVQLVFIKHRANCISLEVLANLIRRKRFS